MDVEREEEKQWDGGGRVGGGVGSRRGDNKRGGGSLTPHLLPAAPLIKLDWYSDDGVIAINELP